MWLLELLADIIGLAVADLITDRMPAWGCALCLLVPVLIILLVWAT
jgi:hypothetical protein